MCTQFISKLVCCIKEACLFYIKHRELRTKQNDIHSLDSSHLVIKKLFLVKNLFKLGVTFKYKTCLFHLKLFIFENSSSKPVLN